ncbi:MAG: ECF-type sigma factor [Holophagales bacterium]|nr:ECF-type sigma factor [Holophagales bacterium]
MQNSTPRPTSPAPALGRGVDGTGDITRLVSSFSAGNREAFDQLMPLVYRDLQRMARRQLRRSSRGHTLDTSALVHELYLKMSKQKGLVAENREHFLSIAARAMRQVVVSHVRRRTAAKRGQPEARTTLDDHHLADRTMENALDVDRALEHLGRKRPRLEQVVEYRFFCGLSEEETAEALGVSVRTVQRDWMRARLWLREALGGSESPRSPFGHPSQAPRPCAATARSAGGASRARSGR